jgi:hypothetical protein
MRMLMQKNKALASPEILEKGTCPLLVNKRAGKSSPMIKPTTYRARPPRKALLKVVVSAVFILISILGEVAELHIRPLHRYVHAVPEAM